MGNIALTIGMPHYDDFDGAVFSIQSLISYHDFPGLEIILVDHTPHMESGRLLKDLCAVHAKHRNVRYVTVSGDIGPSGAKNQVFAEAHGDAVLCMDCHVLLMPKAIERLVKFYAENPGTNDLFSGPMHFDDLVDMRSSLLPEWKGSMLGTWSLDPRAKDADGEPFEVWAQGCGLFTCRRDAWLGFNPDFRGFGGEEGYIQEKYRKAGHKAVCLPWLRWWHRFGRPKGVPYVVDRWDIIRNYMIGFNELGISLDGLYKHYVDGDLLSQANWDYLVTDPVRHVKSPTWDKEQESLALNSELAVVFKQYSENASAGIGRHMAMLREFCARSLVVAEVTNRPESTVSLLCGRPNVMYSNFYGGYTGRIIDTYGPRACYEYYPKAINDISEASVGDCDLLFIEIDEQSRNLPECLARWSQGVAKIIALRGAGDFEPKENRAAIKAFLEKSPAWGVIHHDDESRGFTVLERR